LAVRLAIGLCLSSLLYAFQASGLNGIPDAPWYADKGRLCFVGHYFFDLKEILGYFFALQAVAFFIFFIFRLFYWAVLIFILPLTWGFFLFEC
jgi:hypothetical protein